MQDSKIRRLDLGMIRRGMSRWYCIPILVGVFGIIPGIMLGWTQRIDDGVRTDYVVESALMDAQIRASNFHLWFEEGIAGDATVNLPATWEDLDRAFGLLTSVLEGGETEHDPVLHPLKDLAKRKQVEEMIGHLNQLQSIGRRRQDAPELSGIGSNLDEHFDAAFQSFMEKTRDLELQVERKRALNLARSKRLFWSILCAWISLVLLAALGLWSLGRRRRLAEQALQQANEQLKAQADELMSHHRHLAELVQERTAELRGANEALQTEIVERQQAEKALRRSQKELQLLSARILTAQEEERSRISRELHDELGQALATLKLRIGFIRKRQEDQQLKEECHDVLGYIDEVLEETRRLSRALKPTVIEYFGLSVALKRLVHDFAGDRGIEVEIDIPELGDELPQHAQLNVYRLFQEALNNVGKHAEATQLAVTMERDNGHLHFVLEDNGKGFDLSQAIAGDSGVMGLGLVIMHERVRMLGGTLDISSQFSKGTRVSFHIPASLEESLDGTVSHCAS